MTRTTMEGDRQAARRTLLMLGALTTLAALTLTALIVRLIGTDDTSSGAAPRITTTPSPAATLAADDVTWVNVAGVELPVSRQDGPRDLDKGRAAGYSHTPTGAALAAVQVLARTSATAGPDVYGPVLATQLTGPNSAGMRQVLDQQYTAVRRTLTAGGHVGANNDATVTGYLVDGYDDDSAVVDVLLESASDGQLVGFAVTLRWENGDWRVVAPPNGDWGAVAHRVATAPAGMLDYHRMPR